MDFHHKGSLSLLNILVQNAQRCSFFPFQGCYLLCKGHPSLTHSRHVLRFETHNLFIMLCKWKYSPWCQALWKAERKGPINTKNLDQRAFYYKLCSFLKDSKHDEFLFATEFMKMDGFLCGCFNRVCLAVWGWAANPHRHIHCHP